MCKCKNINVWYIKCPGCVCVLCPDWRPWQPEWRSSSSVSVLDIREQQQRAPPAAELVSPVRRSNAFYCAGVKTPVAPEEGPREVLCDVNTMVQKLSTLSWRWGSCNSSSACLPKSTTNCSVLLHVEGEEWGDMSARPGCGLPIRKLESHLRMGWVGTVSQIIQLCVECGGNCGCGVRQQVVRQE